MTEAKNSKVRMKRGCQQLHLWFAACFTLMLLTLIGASAVQAEAIGGFVVPGSKAASLDQCVEPTNKMRHYHMEYIRHQRDTTVYDGIRHTKYSLSGCVSCHAGHDAQSAPIPVNAKSQFCNACHEKAAVTLNCFDCHATVPDGESWNQVTQLEMKHPNTAPLDRAHAGAGVGQGVGAELAQVPDVAGQEDSQKR